MAGHAINTAAVVLGSFLAGAMVSLSAIAIPVFLDTTSSPAQLYHEWARTYHYGHRVLPALAVTTFLMYSYAGVRKRNKMLVYAGLLTIAMVPFTWIFMTSTNDRLFALNAEGALVASDEVYARALVRHWSHLHLTRTLFPVTGVLTGLVSWNGRARQ